MSDDKYWRNNTWQGTYLILPFDMFRNMQKCEQTFDDLFQFIKSYVKLRTTFCGDVSNTNVKIEYKKHTFAFGVYADKAVGFSVWDDAGSESLASLPRPTDDIPTDEWINELRGYLDEYIDGYVRCSECGKKIKRADIAGKYFAGCYCDQCWIGKWKAIEACETYN